MQQKGGFVMVETLYRGPRDAGEALDRLTSSEFTKTDNPALKLGGQVLTQILSGNRYGRVQLLGDEIPILANAHREARAYFGQPHEDKLRNRTPQGNIGYRIAGAAFNNADRDNHDVNESGLYFGEDTVHLIPHRQNMQKFLDALEQFRSGPVRRIMGSTSVALTQLYQHNQGIPLGMEKDSATQSNCYTEPGSRRLLQIPHDDRVLATVIWVSAAGLEVNQGTEENPMFTPLETGPDEILVMPGAILEFMTAGQFKGLIHQARNHDLELKSGQQPVSKDRISLMSFTNPDLDKGPIEPYVPDKNNTKPDAVRKTIRGFVHTYYDGDPNEYFPTKPGDH